MRLHTIAIVGILALTACSTESNSSDICGDGVVDMGEECDPENFTGTSCADYGYYGGDISCTDTCILDQADCESYGRCGDSLIQEAQGETCDGENLNGLTCADLGEDLMGDGLACDEFCHLDTSGCIGFGECGDGTVQSPGEECEESVPVEVTCLSEGYGFGEVTCSECLYDYSGCHNAVMWGTSAYDLVLAMTRDDAGNLYTLSLTGAEYVNEVYFLNGDLEVRRFSPLGDLEWVTLIETPSTEYGDSLVVHNDSLWLAVGTDDGSVFGSSFGGLSDIAVVELSLDGSILRTATFGTAYQDIPKDLQFDSEGYLYISGNTKGTFNSSANQGMTDGFILKIDNDLNVVDTMMIGGPGADSVLKMAFNANDDLLIAGNTGKGLGAFNTLDPPADTTDGTTSTFLARFNTFGTPAWSRIIYTEYFPTQAYDMALVEGDRIVVVGSTKGNTRITSAEQIPQLDSKNGYVLVFHTNGTFLYQGLIGGDGGETVLTAVTSLGTDIYTTGFTNAQYQDMTAIGLYDNIALRYDYQLNEVWRTMFGTDVVDYANAIVMDLFDNPLVSGSTQGFFPPYTSNAGNADSYFYILNNPQ